MPTDSLSRREINKIVNSYIGVGGGYLGDFSYRTHAEFYPDYCDLNIDPSQFEGTTRIRFITILEVEDPITQATIIRGVIARFPVGQEGAPTTRTTELADELLGIAARLESLGMVQNPTLVITSAVVQKALSDAELLLQQSGPAHAVDRLHTTLHGYLLTVCNDTGIAYGKDPSIHALLTLIRDNHPKFTNLGPREADVKRVLFAFGTMLDALNPIRNQASLAHPNENLLDEAEAGLVINASRSILHYLEKKLEVRP